MLITLSIILVIVSILFWMVAWIAGKVQWLFLALSYAALCALAWLGLDFSPSMTLMFLEVGMICLSLGMVILTEKEVPAVILSIGKVLTGVGDVCMIPAVYMYAFGEDHLSFCICASLLLGVLLSVAEAWRGSYSAGDLILFGLSFTTALFTVFCGIFSSMLLFYGVGLLCLVPVRGYTETRFVSHEFLSWIGLFAIACFSVLPAWL